ncbi:hypothetical protein [Pseudophaeobacter leonis]|uniref:hypothetical protein n=1 Tax=Pseudophaeobacter leonis TaxID=1144477 RepID=UPI0009F3945B|nr:hypothetical protein [Pseudophaeobacter leonis]
MGMRKALGIIVFSTQAVVAFDYNMQSHKAGLAPGELSMKAYAAIVQKRYEAPDSARLAALDALTDPGARAIARPFVGPLTSPLTSAQDMSEAAQAASPDAPAAVCIRRGTALYCQ